MCLVTRLFNDSSNNESTVFNQGLKKKKQKNKTKQKKTKKTYFGIWHFSPSFQPLYRHIQRLKLYVYVRDAINWFNPNRNGQDQEHYIRLTHTYSEDVFKKSSRCLDQDQYIGLGHTSSKRLQDLCKTSCKNVFKISSRRLQDIFKMPSQDVLLRRFQEVSKTSSRHLLDVLQKCLSDVLKMYQQVKLFLLTRFQDVFKTYSKRF